jgi:hypothetical protein
MTVNEKIDGSVALELSESDRAKTSAFIARAVLATCVGAAVGEPACPVRMKRPKCAYRQPVPHHRAYRSISSVLAVAKPIAVLHASAPSGNVARPGSETILDADVLLEYLASPAVMVAGNPEYFDPRVPEIGKSGERTKAGARNDRLPLEPEVEEISVDYERSGTTVKVAQKSHESLLDIDWRDSDVRVRNEIAGRGEHCAIVAARAVDDKPVVFYGNGRKRRGSA